MKKIFPQNKVLKHDGRGDSIGEIFSSFNINLTSNYGAISATRMVRAISSEDEAGFGLPTAFAYHEGAYYIKAGENIFYSSTSSMGAYTKVQDTLIEDNMNTNSDLSQFNGKIYSTIDGDVVKGEGNVWSTADTGLETTGRHIQCVLGDRLYISNGDTKVASISTSDVLALTGSYTVDLGLSNDWSITMVVEYNNSLWIGLNNTSNGKGLVCEWDGQTENILSNKYTLDNGVMSGCVMDNKLYVFDSSGTLLVYNGSFSFVDTIYKRKVYNYDAFSLLNFVHPNGMVATNKRTLLIFVNNRIIDQTYNNDAPSGIYEYDVNTGLYHKYSISISGPTLRDYGQHRFNPNTGALFYKQPSGVYDNSNGVILAGCGYYTDDGVTTSYGAFCDDIVTSNEKIGYIITPKVFSDSIEESFNSIVPIFKKFSSENSKIVVKYKTVDDTEEEISVNINDIDTLTTSSDISAYEKGDEIQFIQGYGSGFITTIKSLSESGGSYTIKLNDNLPSSVIGQKATCLLSKWKNAAEIIRSGKQSNSVTINNSNLSPWIQFKIILKFYGTDELYKYVIRSDNSK